MSGRTDTMQSASSRSDRAGTCALAHRCDCSIRCARCSGFLKTLPSDIDDAAVQKLMLEIKTADAAYKGQR